MTPEQIAALSAIASIIGQVGTWPIASLLAVIVLGPWAIMFCLARSNDKRLEAALKMYESNVKLVVNYEKIANEQVDTIRLSTAATMELTTWLKTRTPCHALLAARLRSDN